MLSHLTFYWFFCVPYVTFYKNFTSLLHFCWTKLTNPHCKGMFPLFSEIAQGWYARPHKQCIKCYRAQRSKRKASQWCRENSPQCPSTNATGSTTPAGTGAIFVQKSNIQESTHQKPALKKRCMPSICHPGQHSPYVSSLRANGTSPASWTTRKFKCTCPYMLQTIEPSTSERCPTAKPSTITAMADTGAQSCLWSTDDFPAVGFTNEDLISVKLDLHAANRSPIHLNDASTGNANQRQ